MTQRKITAKQVAKFKAIRARKAAANDNRNPRCAYVDTTMTPGMLKACIESAGF